MLSLKLFGGASVEGEEGVLSGPATHRHRLALLAVVASSHPRGVARENLMALLWPDTDTTHARNLLNQAVYVLRKALGDGALRTVGDKLYLDPTAAPCDVIAFENAVSQGEFESAVNLYTGPFVDGFFVPGAPEFEHWVEVERERLRLTYCKALDGLARAAEAQGNHSGAVEWWRRLNAADPYSAHVTISLMEALEAAGDRAGAIRQAHSQASLLREDFGAAPHPEVEALAQRIRVSPLPCGDGEVVWSLHEPHPEVETTASHPVTATDGVLDADLPVRGGNRWQWHRWAIPSAFGVLMILMSLWVLGRLTHSESAVLSAGIQADSWNGRTPIVVLPMENLGPPDAGYFAAGMTEEIISRLTAIPTLAVISRSSGQQGASTDVTPAGIGRELGAEYVLDGSVRWSGPEAGYGRVRVTPHLTRVSDGTTIWSDAYERDMADMFAVQIEIAEAVAVRLGVQLGEMERQIAEDRPTDNLEAYHAYLKGKYYNSRRLDLYSAENWNQAIAHFERAVSLDPTFVLAYVGLVGAHAVLVNHGYDPSEERRRMARAALERAIELAPDEPEVWLARGEYHYFVELDYDEALMALEIAESGIPEHPQVLKVTGFLYRRLGRWDEALERFHRILRLHPDDLRAAHFLGETYHLMHRYEEAAQYIDLTIALAPDAHSGYRNRARLHWTWTGDLATARAALDSVPAAQSMNPEVVRAWVWQDLYEGHYSQALRRLQSTHGESEILSLPDLLLDALLHDLAGDPVQARQAYAAARIELEEALASHPRDEIRSPRLRGWLGIAHAGLGQRDDAIREGEAAAAVRPLSIDGLVAPQRLQDLALIYAMVGEKDAALDQIETLLSVPSWLSVPLLEIDPRWTPLRDHPRYRALVEQM